MKTVNGCKGFTVDCFGINHLLKGQIHEKRRVDVSGEGGE